MSARDTILDLKTRMGQSIIARPTQARYRASQQKAW